jgi:vitamin B12 transporter
MPFRNTSKYLLVALPLLCPFSALAQEATSEQPVATSAPETEEPDVEIVVTPTRTQRSLSETASSVTVITRRQIEEKKPLDVTDIIRMAPGLSIAQSGTRGKVGSIFLRGSNANQTLVLIDGVRANSPADGRFDIGNLAVENIERVEVLRGPQSALYGAEAIGGVVNIITRRGSGPLRIGGLLEYGSQSANRQAVTARGELGPDSKSGIAFSASRTGTKGFFANDDYRSLAASLRYDHALSAASNLAITGRFEDSEVGTPGQRFLAFDPNARSKPRLFNGSVSFTNEARDGEGVGATVRRRDRVTLGVTDRDLDFNNPINPGSAFPSFTNSKIQDRVLVADAQTTFERGRHSLSFGGELRRDSAEGDSRSSFGNTFFDQSTTTRALWLQDEFRSGRLLVVPGLRYEDNSQYDSDLNGRLAVAYELKDASRLKASAATGFRAPSINELYFPGFGDPTLRPEQSTGFEVGYERPTSRGGRFEVTAFTTRYRDLIGTVAVPTSPQYPFGSKAGNAARARVNGLELSVDQPLGRGLSLNLNHAFLSTSSSAGPLLRRPRFVSSADLIYRRDKLGADLGVVAQGRRFDNDFAGPPFGSGRGAGFYKGFTRVDLTLSYAVRPELEAYVRAGNLLGTRYEEAAGFPAPRFNFVLGVQTRVF